MSETPRMEKRAILGDMYAGLRVVSALRTYRQAAQKLLSSRYSDGECDSVAISNFADACLSAEDLINEVDRGNE